MWRTLKVVPFRPPLQLETILHPKTGKFYTFLVRARRLENNRSANFYVFYSYSLPWSLYVKCPVVLHP